MYDLKLRALMLLYSFSNFFVFSNFAIFFCFFQILLFFFVFFKFCYFFLFFSNFVERSCGELHIPPARLLLVSNRCRRRGPVVVVFNLPLFLLGRLDRLDRLGLLANDSHRSRELILLNLLHLRRLLRHYRPLRPHRGSILRSLSLIHISEPTRRS